jgi:large subunit ribosomal protein L14
MQAIGSRISKCLDIGSRINCADNTGAKILQILSVKGYKGRRRRRGRAGVADLVTCSVKSGSEKMRKKVVQAVVIRQNKEYRRPDGRRIKFGDNAAVVLKEGGLPQGTEIKGPIAKEVAERYPKIAPIAKIVV